MRAATGMLPALMLAFALLPALSTRITASERPAPALTLTAYTGDYLQIYDERIYRKCRKKVRRTLGKARGKNAKAYRLAYTQHCMINGGTHW